MNPEKTARYYKYLNKLRESGETNMFGARPYLMRQFPELSDNRGAEAGKVLSEWMRSFTTPTHTEATK